MRLASILAVAALAVAGCNKTTGGSAKTGSSSTNGACASGKVDLTKLSGDWIANSAIAQPDGNIPGSQYRIRFAGPPAADGSVKAQMAWRLDARPFSGKLTPKQLGGSIDLLEDMTDETVTQL
ncbi:MAG: hypothetical protein ACREFI_14310, partial [Stellaceae bacterium]